MEPLRALRALQAARGGLTDGVRPPSRYTEPLLEHRAVRTGSGLLERPGRGLLLITGADAATWLQGLVSNDVRHLKQAGDRLLACQLDAKGHMVADLVLVQLEDAILVDMDMALLQQVTALWDDLLITEDVELHDVSNEWFCISVQGPEAAEVVGTFRNERALVVPADHTGSGGVDLYIPADRAPQQWEWLAERVQPVGLEVAEILRVEAGIPRHLVDTDSSVIPVEAGLANTHISYDKGCYIGQEIIARLHSRGHTNRAFTGLLPEGNLRTGVPLTLPDAPERPVGRVTSAVHSIALDRPIALGYVRHESRSPGSLLIAQGPDFQVRVTVSALPFPGAL